MTSVRKRISGLINVSKDAKPICIAPEYIKLTKDLKAAALLNQIVLWSDVTKDPDGWFYKTFDEWGDELGLSKFEINRAIKGDKRYEKDNVTLASLGVETTVKKNPKGKVSTHYRIVGDALEQALRELLKPVISEVNLVDNAPESHNTNSNLVAPPKLTKLPHQSELSCDSLNTDNTTDKTTERETTSKSKILDITPQRPHVFISLPHRKSFYFDGQRIDPVAFPIDYNALFYAYCDALEENGYKRSREYDDIWKDNRDGIVALAKARTTPEQLKQMVKFMLEEKDKDGSNWYRANGHIPKAERIAERREAIIDLMNEPSKPYKPPGGIDPATIPDDTRTPEEIEAQVQLMKELNPFKNKPAKAVSQ